MTSPKHRTDCQEATEPDVVWDPLSGEPVRIESLWPGFVMLLNELRVVKFGEGDDGFDRKVVRFNHEVWLAADTPSGKTRERVGKPGGMQKDVPWPGFAAFDDVGTQFSDMGGAHGRPGTGALLEGEWDIFPTPPKRSSYFDLTFYCGGPSDGQRRQSHRIRMATPLPQVTFEEWVALTLPYRGGAIPKR